MRFPDRRAALRTPARPRASPPAVAADRRGGSQPHPRAGRASGIPRSRRSRSRRRRGGLRSPAAARRPSATGPAPGAAEAIEAGGRIWTRKFPNGRSLAGCFPNGGRRIAAAYPQYDPRVKRLVTLETAINQCLKTHGQPLLEAGDAATMGAVLAYLRSLADGQKIAVRATTAPAEGALRGGPAPLLHAHGPAELRVRVLPRRSTPGSTSATPPSPRPSGAAVQWPLPARRPRRRRCRCACASASTAWAPHPSRPAPTSSPTSNSSSPTFRTDCPSAPNAWRPPT